MHIVNDRVLNDLRNEVALKLDLGAGGPGQSGFYSVDRLSVAGVDVVADLNEPLSEFPANCADVVYTRHALEHVTNFLGIMSEIHRITRPTGRVEIVVPHFSNVYGHSDPTHVRVFGLYSMYYFVDESEQPRRKVPAFYSTVRFHLESIRIEFYVESLLDQLVGPLAERLVNRSFGWQEMYERRFAAFFHAWQIRYVMRPAK